MAVAFLYCWTDKKENKIYLGVHKGNSTDGYICSSKLMLEEYSKRINDFSRQVIATGSYDDMISLETAILKSVNAAKDPLFYNQHNGDGNFYNKGHAEETKEKFKAAWKRNPNRSNGWKGKKLSVEHKQKLSEAKIGKKLTEEHKEKIGQASRRNAKNPEYIAKLSAANKLAWEKRRD